MYMPQIQGQGTPHEAVALSVVDCLVAGSDATPEDYQSIAVHFENEKNHFMAGKFFLLSEQFVRVGVGQSLSRFNFMVQKTLRTFLSCFTQPF